MIASRLSIAWSSRPAAKEEDVSVIGGKRFFADIRVTADERRALSWAMAGTRLAGPKQADGGIICEFTHTVDSRSLEPESDSIVDIGTNYEESNNPLITIERGRMLNPASGLDEDHVETWLDEVIPTGTPVIFLERDDGRAILGKVGRKSNGVGRTTSTNDIFAWSKIGNEVVYSIGVGEGLNLLDDVTLIQGSTITDRGGVIWHVRESWATGESIS